MNQMRDALYDVIRMMLEKKQYRVKRAALYLTIVDDNGKPARMTFEDEITIHPHISSADQYDP